MSWIPKSGSAFNNLRFWSFHIKKFWPIKYQQKPKSWQKWSGLHTISRNHALKWLDFQLPTVRAVLVPKKQNIFIQILRNILSLVVTLLLILSKVKLVYHFPRNQHWNVHNNSTLSHIETKWRKKQYFTEP